MLASLADLKLYLAVTSTGDDALLTRLLDAAGAQFTHATRRTWEAAADTTRRFDALADVSDGGRLLRLGGEVASITTVTNGDGTAVAASAYVTEPRGTGPWRALRLKASSGLTWTYTTDPEDAIVIMGKWASSLTPPSDVAQAVLEMAAYFYRRRGAEGLSYDQPQVSPSGVMIYPPGFPESVKATIKRRRWTDEAGLAV